MRTDICALIEKGEKIVGPESDEPLARDVPVEAADIRVGSKEAAGKTLAEPAGSIGHGLQLKAMFRMGEGLPILPDTRVQIGDVLRLIGPDFCIFYIDEISLKAQRARSNMSSLKDELPYQPMACL